MFHIIILVGDERGSGLLKFSGCGSGSASVRCLGGTHHRHPPPHGRTLCFLARSPIALVSPFSLSLQYILFVTTRKIKNLKFDSRKKNDNFKLLFMKKRRRA